MYTCLYLCDLINVFRYSICLMLYYRDNLLQSCQVMSSLGNTTFVSLDMHNFTCCDVSFRVTCLQFSSSFILFISSFPSSTAPALETLICSRVLFPYNFLFLMWLSLHMLQPVTGDFIFKVLCFLYPVVELALCARSILFCKNYKILC